MICMIVTRLLCRCRLLTLVSCGWQGGWGLVSEHLPYATGAARSILLDRLLQPDQFKVGGG